MYSKKEEYGDTLINSAITPAEVKHCRRSVKIGDFFMVKVPTERGEQGKDVNRIKRGRVTGKYKHVVTLDCGILSTLITYVQILQRLRHGKKYID